MAATGPIPKRDDERVRRNTPEVPTTTVTAIGAVAIPELDLERLGCTEVHPLVVDIYDGLKESAQRRFFEPSDWQHARLTMYVLNDMLVTDGIGAMKLQAINGMLSDLLVTEGDRRRVRMEIDRKPSTQTASVTSIADHYRQQLGVT